MKKIGLLFVLVVVSLNGMHKKSLFSRTLLQPFQRMHHTLRTYPNSFWNVRVEPRIFKNSRFLASTHFSYSQDYSYNALIPVLIAGTAVCAGTHITTKCSAEEKDLSVDAFIAEYQENSYTCNRMLAANKAQAITYARYIAEHCEEIMSKKEGRAVLTALLQDHTLTEMHDLFIPALSSYIKKNFVAMIMHGDGVKFLETYCLALRKKDETKSVSFEQEMAIFSRLFIDSFEAIIKTIPERLLFGFFTNVEPYFETTLLKNYETDVKHLFKKYCSELVDLTQYANNYSLYACLKLMFKANMHEHEQMFVTALFQKFESLQSLNYLDSIQTKQARQKACEYVVSILNTICMHKEIVELLCYWIHCDGSLAHSFSSDHVLNVLIKNEHGAALLPYFCKANHLLEKRIEALKKEVKS